MLAIEYEMMYGMAEQLQCSCTAMEAARTLADETADAAEIAQIDKTVADTRSIIDKVEEMLKNIDKSTLIDEE